MSDDVSSPTARRDPWPLLVFLAHVAHGGWFAQRYPHGIWDPDLLAYFVYFQNWIRGATSLHGIEYFPVPKPLLVSLLGPIGAPELAFVLTTVVSGLLGTLVYLVCRRAFGRPVAVVTALVLLLDVDRALLTMRSNADLYVATLLFAAIWCTDTRRVVLSGVAIGLAALIKPVAVPCALHLLVVDGPDRGRARWAAMIPVLALPLVALGNVVFLGSASGAARFFAAFDAQHPGGAMGPSALLHFVAWVQMKEVIFGSTAAFGVVGLVVWLTRDRARLRAPLLLVPLLLLAGYAAMSVVVPFVPMSRFFWGIQVWFMGFIVAGMLEAARRLVGDGRGLRVAAGVLLVAFLADDLFARQLDYRRRATDPLERAMTFVEQASIVLASERREGETVLASVALVPWLVWRLDDVRQRPGLVQTTLATGGAAPPDWVLYVPAVVASAQARADLDRLLATGAYELRIASGPSALLARRGRPALRDRHAAVTR